MNKTVPKKKEINFGFTFTRVDYFPLKTVLETTGLRVSEVESSGYVCEHRTKAGNVVHAFTVRSGESFGECPSHHYVGHGVHRDVEPVKETCSFTLIVHYEMSAQILEQRVHFVNVIHMES
jgi:hypothetical protein